MSLFLSSYPSSVFLFFKSMYLAYYQRALRYGISLMSIHPLTNNFSLWGSFQVGHSVSCCKQGSGGTVLTQTLCTWCCRVGCWAHLWLNLTADCPGAPKKKESPRKESHGFLSDFNMEDSCGCQCLSSTLLDWDGVSLSLFCCCLVSLLPIKAPAWHTLVLCLAFMGVLGDGDSYPAPPVSVASDFTHWATSPIAESRLYPVPWTVFNTYELIYHCKFFALLSSFHR